MIIYTVDGVAIQISSSGDILSDSFLDQFVLSEIVEISNENNKMSINSQSSFMTKMKEDSKEKRKGNKGVTYADVVKGKCDKGKMNTCTIKPMTQKCKNNDRNR